MIDAVGAQEKATLAAGGTIEVIVEYDVADIDDRVSEMRSRTKAFFDDQAMAEGRAAEYAKRKRDTLAAFPGGAPPPITRDYSHLPMAVHAMAGEGAVERLLAQPGVRAVYSVVLHHRTLGETLPYIRANEAQTSAGFSGAGTTVAVIDTGADYTRAAFGSCAAPGPSCRIVFAQDFAPSDGVPDNDPKLHGTNVAAIVLGVAPGARVAALDVFTHPTGGRPTASSTDVLAAMNWAIANKFAYNIVAMNLSVGDGGRNPGVCASYATAPIAAASAVGIATVASSGNDGFIDGINAPACAQGAISVGAVAAEWNPVADWLSCAEDSINWGFPGKVPCFSNQGGNLTMYAPGVLVTAAGVTLSGTSQAAPHVAGALAGIRALWPSEPIDASVRRLTSTGRLTTRGGGVWRPILNLMGALFPKTELRVTILGDGVVNISPDGVLGMGSGAATQCGADCTATLPSGRRVMVNAQPSAGWQLGGWQAYTGLDVNDRTACGAGAVDVCLKGYMEANAQATALFVAPFREATSVSRLGNGHACVVTKTGGVKCWGANESGQLGDGTTTTRPYPVDVQGLPGVAQSVAAGGSHSCALLVGGNVYCWGSNVQGQLGDGTVTNRALPVLAPLPPAGPPPPPGLPPPAVVALAAGWAHTCAIVESSSGSSLYCWGQNDRGQIGQGSVTPASTSPLLVSGLGRWVLVVAAGHSHTCALRNDSASKPAATVGSVACWGDNRFGSVGDGTGIDRFAPVAVAGLGSDIGWLASSCAAPLGGAGGISCWGAGRYRPVEVYRPFGTLSHLNDECMVSNGVMGCWAHPAGPWPVGQSPVTAIGTGADNYCAILSTGELKCRMPEGFGNVVWPGPASNTFARNLQATVASYYQTILGRAPDPGGLGFWSAEAARIMGLGGSVREAFFAMSIQFFSSPEYLGRNTSNEQYLTDLYRTFFGREPDAPGLAFWLGELAATGSRSAILNSFLFSPEFAARFQALFGANAARPEVDMTLDLYRGSLGRLPDSAGFQFWLERLRAAQCQGASAISTVVNGVADLFFTSAEYAARARGDRDFVGDTYNAYMRRGPGGDSAGFNYWAGQIPALGRDGVRARFVPSQEFQSRVSALVAAGCAQ